MSQPESKIPEVTFEEMLPEDIPSGLSTLKVPYWSRVIIEPIESGYEKFLQWALEEIESAGTYADNIISERYAVNAVMHARRALSCLVDQYLLRDGFKFCRDAPKETKDKTGILVRRHIFDELAATALERSVNTRNEVEHRYRELDIAQAQDVVHNVRTTIENAVGKSSPYLAPAYLGIVQGGSMGNQEVFGGWIDPIFILVTTLSPQWLGILIPRTDTHAVLRKVKLSELSCSQLLDSLEICESIGEQGYSGFDPDTWRRKLQSWGLIE